MSEPAVEAELQPELLPLALEPRQRRVRDILWKLAQDPPQVLLLEGGEENVRLGMAVYWAALLNCEAAPEDRPCQTCPTCRRLSMAAHRDLFLLDGRTESIKIDSVRELRPVLGQEPHEVRKRAVLFVEAQSLGEAAANALLKSLEEPKPSTCFVLTAPQRERLLPTLVSRSFVLTLAWPPPGAPEGLEEWEAALAGLLADGRGWFGRTMNRGAVDQTLARNMIRLLRARLRDALAGDPPQGPLGRTLAGMSAPALRRCGLVLIEAQNALVFMVNPSLVLDWLVAHLYRFAREG